MTARLSEPTSVLTDFMPTAFGLTSDLKKQQQMLHVSLQWEVSLVSQKRNLEKKQEQTGAKVSWRES